MMARAGEFKDPCGVDLNMGGHPPEELRVRLYGPASAPTLVYLPGIHGDWTLIPSFRAALHDRVRFVEFTYPRHLHWALPHYATAIREALLNHGISQAWLLGESFGSQVAWALIDHGRSPGLAGQTGLAPTESWGRHPFPPGAGPCLDIQGLILAGGFVRHPWMPAVRFIQKTWSRTPLWLLRRFTDLYVLAAPIRHRHAPETLASLPEFVSRRNPEDKQAIGQRFRLIAANDPAPVARRFNRPVFCLSGGIDPIVPWPWVKRWLKKNCPSYRGSRIIALADHNVLATAPRESAQCILHWMGMASPG